MDAVLPDPPDPKPEPPSAQQSDQDALWNEVKGVATHPFFDARSFWSQRQRLLNDPVTSLSQDPRVMPTKPIAFGIQSLLIPSLVTAALLWLLTAVFGLRPAPELSARALYETYRVADSTMTLQRDSLTAALSRLRSDSIIAAEYVAKDPTLNWGAGTFDTDPRMRPLRIGLQMIDIRSDSTILADALSQHRLPRAILRTVIVAAPLKIFYLPIFLLVPAVVFRRQLARHTAKFPAMRAADRVYLYYGTARAFWAATFIAVAAFVVNLSARLGWITSDADTWAVLAVILVGCVWILIRGPGTIRGMCTAFGSPQANAGGPTVPLPRLVNWALLRTAAWMTGIYAAMYIVVLFAFLTVAEG
jgi:hypothetical protein